MTAAALAIWAIAIVPSDPKPPPPVPPPPAEKKGPAPADPAKKDPVQPRKPPAPNPTDAQKKRLEDEKALQEAGKTLEKTLSVEKDPIRRAGAILDFCHAIQPLDASLHRTRVSPFLQRLYQRESRPEIRASILEGFQFLDAPQATFWITGELRTSMDPVVRAAAARSLGGRRDAAALPALHEKLTDIEPAVLRDVIRALAEIRDLSSAPPLINVGMQTVLHRGASAPKDSEKRQIYVGLLEDVVRALQAISGENFGANQDEWQKWWNARGRVLLEEAKKRPPTPPVPKTPPAIPGKAEEKKEPAPKPPDASKDPVKPG